ncbi:zinc finger CCCH domain-containing protein 3 [Onthophagus taurus]|uniref:zinc finger CCCH domain-containing protein 3 n=1 Tax=Onthophagus taurus TaxID=166361 RepID=UPI0039BEC4F6
MDYNNSNSNYGQIHPISNNSSLMMPNRFVYVNQNFQKPCVVLVNPNFKKTVHINPNFKGTIHVNPNIIKLQNKPISNDDYNNKVLSVERLGINLNENKDVKLSVKTVKSPLKERRKSLHTKYKIVHQAHKIDEWKKIGIKSKYKIDKRVDVGDKKKIIRTRYKLSNLGDGVKKSNKFVNISGVLYKKTPNVLKKANLSLSESPAKKKLKVFKRNGRIYKLSNTSLDLSKRLSLNKKKLLLSQTRNFNKQIFMSKMKKCNIPCPIYRKFGVCYGKDKGKCFRAHNPHQIDLCTKFLQGACLKKNCLLSHKVSPEKMPTCKYYLEGLCTREDCPYLHVKINPKADICNDFLEGFCKKAKECDKRHQFLCPNFEKTGKCPKKHCQYPHGNSVRKFTFKAKVAKKNIKVLKAKIDKIKNKCKREIEEKDVDNDCKGKGVVRYFIDTDGDQDLLKEAENVVEVGDVDLDASDVVYKRKSLGELPSFIPLGE